MKKFEEKKFSTYKDMADFFKAQKEADIWHPIYSEELESIPVPDCQIAAASMAKDLEVEPDALLEVMEDTGLVLRFPINDRLKNLPLRYTGYNSLLDRAGIAGPAVVGSKKLSPEDISNILKICLSRKGSGKALLLLRDNQVSAVLSGDPKDYSPLPVIDLLRELEGKLFTDFPHWEFVNGQVNHELVASSFALHNDDICKCFADLLIKSGISAELNDISAYLRFSTSDIGTLAATATPYMKLKGIDIPIGKPITVNHKNGHKPEDFGNALSGVMASFIDGVSKLEKLNTVYIHHPVGCFRAIAKHIAMPKKQSLILANELEMRFSSHTTALDIYFALNELVYNIEYDAKEKKKNISLSQRINLSESVARTMNFKFSDYDFPFEWD